ncbi:MAG TPA: L,D-transpeptidase [Polyangia bacterium]|nr:L,D-transpeptidase [Polyangia bacterium]
MTEPVIFLAVFRWTRWRHVLAFSLLFAGACGGRGDAGAIVFSQPAAPDGASKPAPVHRAAPPLPDVGALPAASGLPPERRAIQLVGGIERVVDADVARAQGLTLVDLSDDWAPAIFDDGAGPGGAVLPNHYRSVFTGLAANRTDGDGQPLDGDKNYLELYGVPPTLGVLRERFLADAARKCDPTFDVAKMLAVDEITTWGATTEQKERAKHHARGVRLEAARVKANVDTLEALAAADPRYAKDVKAHLRREAEQAAFAEVEKRLACEGSLDLAKHKAGTYDTPMRKAMFDFQQEHTVFDQADLKRTSLEALARPLLENDFAALRRVLEERAVHAGRFVEDGSSKATYAGSDGARHAVPDLATAATDAVMARLGLATPEDALAFFQRHAARDFRSLRAAVQFPPLPEYHAAQMDLSVEIDRGDVWYDFPYDEKGVRQPQPRQNFPSFTLYTKWRGERVPLVRWRTTVGGWRGELAADGQEYLRWKGSDVGKRVWRHIVTTPVWIPPTSSPLGSMVKIKKVNGMFVPVTNYDETGPGYLSAYGLVAAIHEQIVRAPDGGVGYYDNGIRTHGSFDYMSLRGRFSHGCHRLYNNLALRMFSFVLEHRHARTLGSVALGFKRDFWSKGDVFEMRLPSRGFYYELDPPMPVEVLEGRIMGERQKPLSGYQRKPGVTYAASSKPPAEADSPESRAGGAESP